MFVGEAPGKDEDRVNEQFVGEAGEILRDACRSVGLDLDDCWKTNAVICRPPGNEIQNDYIYACQPTLTNTIQELQPKVIILLGASAVRSLISHEWSDDIGKIGRWIGWTIPSATFGAWLCPTFHPSYIGRSNRDPVLSMLLRHHIRTAARLEKVQPEPIDQNRLLASIELIPDVRQAKLRLRELATKDGSLTFDYETTGLKPERPEQEIFTASFVHNSTDAFACRIDSSCHRALSKVLLNDRLLKRASNLKFEERWTRQKLGHPVLGWDWDTMLAAHVADNRPYITSIKFQSYVQLGHTHGVYEDLVRIVAPYFDAEDANALNRIKEAPLGDLLRYNGMDSWAEDLVATRQMASMKGV